MQCVLCDVKLVQADQGILSFHTLYQSQAAPLHCILTL